MIADEIKECIKQLKKLMPGTNSIERANLIKKLNDLFKKSGVNGVDEFLKYNKVK
jgi:hypothetical protein